ncbi:MAG: sensor histidine kinase N-terminal domain-containing protein [Gammaproteobacteria bacterium]|jgi:two-component system sensor histidine kinase QseC|nr:sensor histidine kinase N-terminal domain-containing protein [Gammaproteobacteria bacterium]
MSIRRRLLVLLMGSITLAWLLAALGAYVDTHREVDRLLDAHLAHVTSILTAQTSHELLELETGDLLEPGDYAQQASFQVWLGGTELILKSADAPGIRLSGTDAGFADSTAAGRKWRVFTAWDQTRSVLIEVAEEHAVRERIAARVAFNVLLPLGITLPLLGLLIWWSVSRALRPLDRLGEQLGARQAMALEPLDSRDIPSEAAPLVGQINDLFTRIRHSTDMERRFTADAAHELRKPVAAVRAQAEVARSTGDEAVRSKALDQVIHACDRMGVLMEQLLTLARLEQAPSMQLQAPQDLALIARNAIAELAPAALQNGIEISLETSGNSTVTGQAALLDMLVRNLVGNAIQHGKSDVQVGVEAAPEGVRLTVRDAGPGVSPADLAQLGERFFRGQATGAGSGLGLSIVRRIADLHRAALDFSSDVTGRGFVASATFPAGDRN